MILLLTGQPGHGKTAYALVRARKLKEEGRTVYAHGVKDLDHDAIGFHAISDPKDWQSLPDGSVVLIDECYTTFPSRNPGSKVPDHVEAMARHRHRGFDFILIAQQGLQLDPFLRGLIEEHIHVKRKFGKATKLKRWSSYQSNVNGLCSDASDWIRPNDIFKFYTSTTLNTSRLHIPMWLKLIALCLVILGGIVWYIKGRYEEKTKALAHPAGLIADAAGARGERVTGASAKPEYRTPTDYAKAHLPRFATMPWTAPVFDERRATADPQLLCMSSEAGQDVEGVHRDASCTCLTEQGTKYDISHGECRRIARDGPVYNPYRQQSHTVLARAEAAPDGQGATRVPVEPVPAAGAVLSAPQVTSYGNLAVPTQGPPGDSR